MSDSPDIQLVHRAWEAITQGDLDFLQGALARDAKWRAVEDGPWNCEDRAAILDVMAGNLAAGLRGRIEEALQDGPRVLVAFRPERPRPGADAETTSGRVVYMVVTIHDSRIVEMKGCADRAAAIAYMQTGIAPAPRPETWEAVRPPDEAGAAPEQRVSGLIPFVRVTDVERSVAFYQRLGFLPKSVYTPGGRLVWAALQSNGAELMLSGPGDPIDTEQEGVLFYLYASDLRALRDQLLAADVQVGEIVDGTPGPRQEMRVIDPDGYLLMIAEIEPANGR
ncbi:MAG: VOC family protein [Solirubrobacteraceae bacterium]